MRILRVIHWDKLRQEYHQERLRKPAWLRAIKEVSRRCFWVWWLGHRSGPCWQCGGHYGSDGVYRLVGPESVVFRRFTASGNGSIENLLKEVGPMKSEYLCRVWM